MLNKKKALRIGTLLCILLLLLIPLLSSPVAAAFTFDVGTAWTNNTPGGPTVGHNGPGEGSYGSADSTPRTATFKCVFDFSDTSGNVQTPSSRHYGEIEVFKNPSGPRQTKTTGVIYLNDGGSYTVSFTITDTYTVGELPVTWDIMVYVECKDIPSDTRVMNTWNWDYTMN